MNDTPRTSGPSIALPRGGGAIRGIGEKFAASPVTGTGSMSVPIATSPGRSGFSPQLSLTYDSAAGNGPFGFGWTLSLPAITRKTEKGLPRYDDAAGSDVFLLSGAEDLVPVAGADDLTSTPGYRIRRYRPRVEGLFARIERWTKVDDVTDVHWRSITGANHLTLYGKDGESRITDPSDPSRIFSWLICETRDDRGNGILYRYKPEDGVNLDLARSHERNRGDADDVRRQTNRYLKRIQYGNRTPLLDDEGRRPVFLTGSQIEAASRMFEVVFDYGEHDPDAPRASDDRGWPGRNDPFSTYRAGFEVRTQRLCQRVLMFHHFPEEPEVLDDCLVRSTDFTYPHEQLPDAARDPVYSFLVSVAHTGYRRREGGYDRRSMPPVDFEYTRPVIQKFVEEVDPASLENLPIGLNDSYQWTDLHGEGLPGILTEQGGAWFYKRNLSPISEREHDGLTHVEARFSAVELVADRPNLMLEAGAQLLDLAGDGQPDLVVLDGSPPGLYEHDEAESWLPFQPFTSRLARAMDDPNLRFVDLDGDGQIDVLITESDAFLWHRSLGEAGFASAQRVAQALDEEKGPRLVFADAEQAVYLADLSGDGMTDLVRIRNGEVCYWPNLGYGRFGAKVAMDNAPWFDHSDQFEQRRVRLADIDGSGTTDLLYLGTGGVQLYFNQSGNSWSTATTLDVFPPADRLTSVIAADLLGNGTACLVWSSPLPGEGQRAMRYVSLVGDEKPHLLVRVVNNLGAETRVHYAPSTKFYLQDRRDGRPWITRLPFPVHLVERVETLDQVSRNRFVTRYEYHHGHFDGEEREFRGFGLVDQFDTEEFASLSAGGELPVSDNFDAASHVPPVLTRTWFHTGIHLGQDRVSRYFAGLEDGRDRGEYYREPAWLDDDAEASERLLPDTVLPKELAPEEEREAARALKGMLLRQEVYGLDGAGKDADYPYGHPYSVSEQNFTVRLVQPRGENRYAVFLTHSNEALTYQYERQPADPRIQHVLTLEADAYGNVLKAAAVGYGRRAGDPELPTDADRARQTTSLITYTESEVTNPIDDPGLFPADYRVPLTAEVRAYELTGYTPSGTAGRYRPEDLVQVDPADPTRLIHLRDGEIPYEAAPPAGRQRRLIERVRTLYRSDDLSALLSTGELEPLALPGETYRLAFTPGLLAHVYRRPLDTIQESSASPPETLLPDPAKVLPVDAAGGDAADRGGYVELDGDGHWWITSGRVFLSPTADDTAGDELAHARGHFFLPYRTRDPFHTSAVATESAVTYDRYDLLVREARDALGSRITAGQRLSDGALDPAVPGNDYRVLQPRLTTDANGNRSAVAFDILGMVVGTAVMGKPPPATAEGDSLDAFETDLDQTQLDDLFGAVDPHEVAAELLSGATTRIVYDLDQFRRTRKAHPDDPGQWQPVCAATLSRETHLHDPVPPDGLRIQIGFTYADGFGRDVQTKVQAAPGPVPQRGAAGAILVGPGGEPLMTDEAVTPRWVGTGWIVLNNKGKPVRQFEPFFTDLRHFERDVRIGVSPVLLYDPTGRVVATLHPNHSWQKVEFSPWRAISHDVNDTVTSDPRDDPAVRGFFLNPDGTSRLPEGEYLPTWHSLRTESAHAAEFAARYPDPTDRANEVLAAAKAAAHAETPATAHLDTLGRVFLTTSHNRVICPGHDLDGTEERIHTRVELDIEGNPRVARDAIEQNGDPSGRLVMRYDYDLLGNRIHQASMDAGERWMLNDATGQPIRGWDSRGQAFRSEYDPLRRPLRSFVTGADPGDPPETVLIDRMVYGEQHPEAESRNLRGKLYLALDPAGEATTEAHDFSGNPLVTTRRMARSYTRAPDWQAVDAALPGNATEQLDPGALEAALAPLLEADTYTSRTRLDALGRPVLLTRPHSSSMQPSAVRLGYDEAGLLVRLDANLRNEEEGGQPVWRRFVSGVGYDARGQRSHIDYGNGVRTRFGYDPRTFELAHLLTSRDRVAFPADCPEPPPDASPGCQVQNLHYTRDPVGNLTAIRDDAQQTVFFRNRRVEPSAAYTYDAAYRLIEATGREHLGQTGGQRNPPTPADALNGFQTRLDHPGDGDAMGRYIERYVHDAAGNFLKMQHRGSDPAHAGWTRSYVYEEPSLLETGKRSNRLTRTTVGMQDSQPVIDSYSYDAHGNVTRMPHLPRMTWDFDDQLVATSKQAVSGGGTPEITYSVYDLAGQRVRKVTERQAPAGVTPTRKEERLYLGGFEIFREYEADGATVKLERETLHVMNDTQRVALVETRTRGDDGSPTRLVRYQYGNHLGSANLELDDEAGILSYEEYLPYGATSYQAVRSGLDRNPKRYRFTGKERDEESGLYYHGARYYAPWLGKWVSCDPAGFQSIAQDGTSSYAAFALNPIRYRDPDGASPDDPPEDKPPTSPGSLKNRIKATARKVTFIIGNLLGNNPDTPTPPPLEPSGAAGAVGDPSAKTQADEAERTRAKNRPVARVYPPPPPPEGTRLVTAKDLHALRNQGNATPVETIKTEPTGGKRLVTVKDLHDLRTAGNAGAVSPIEPGEGGAGGKRGGPTGGSLVTTTVTVAATALVVFGRGSAREKVETLATGYVIGKGTEAIATRVVGAELAGIMSLPVALVIGMCGDQANACEDQARARAHQEMLDEIDARADAIYASELMQGNNPEWPFVYEKAVHEKYVALGLDKVDEARRKLLRAQDPDVCSNLSLPFPSSIANTPYTPGNSAAQLHQR